eukprot:gb/GECG01011976.1/.p1 GENE.gb/GECG01011976.1/~~gb/GECG01011976.1/.p1  ORF type:complete len:148 (+),score=7.77 gb/GECG01011976.1/:1-444(+)
MTVTESETIFLNLRWLQTQSLQTAGALCTSLFLYCALVVQNGICSIFVSQISYTHVVLAMHAIARQTQDDLLSLRSTTGSSCAVSSTFPPDLRLLSTTTTATSIPTNASAPIVAPAITAADEPLPLPAAAERGEAEGMAVGVGPVCK